MGQQEVWLPEQTSELSSMKRALLFSLYGSGTGHHTISSCRGFGAALWQTLRSALMPRYPEVKQSCPKPQTGLNWFLCSWKCKGEPQGMRREASVRVMSSSLEGRAAPSSAPAAAAGTEGPCKARQRCGQASCCLSVPSVPRARLGGRGGALGIPGGDAAPRGMYLPQSSPLVSGWAEGGEQGHGTNIHSPHPLCLMLSRVSIV